MRTRHIRIANHCACVAAFLAILLVAVASPHIACAASVPSTVQVEGEYYGKETIVFSLRMTQDRFVKSYSNGVTIAGMKTARGPVYYFVKKDGKLIVKVSQDNLYRIGEVTNWETMTRLTTFVDDAHLVKENRTDTEHSCRWYNAEKEKVRLCMNEQFGLPVYLESKGKIIMRANRMNYTNASVDPETLVNTYRRTGYRFIDADEDISPDMD